MILIHQWQKPLPSLAAAETKAAWQNDVNPYIHRTYGDFRGRPIFEGEVAKNETFITFLILGHRFLGGTEGAEGI